MVEGLIVPHDSSPSSPARESLKGAMTGIASAIGPVNRLDEAIIAAQPNHPDMKLVKHRDEKAFVIASIRRNTWARR